MDLLGETGVLVATSSNRRQLRIVDGTIVKEPGKTGSQWRILYSLQLPGLGCDFFDISATEGEGTGESFRRVPIEQQDLVLGDAGYWSTAGIEFVQSRGADVLVRVNPQTFVAYGPRGHRVGLLTRLRSLREPGQIGDWKVVLRGDKASNRGSGLCGPQKRERHSTRPAPTAPQSQQKTARTQAGNAGVRQICDRLHHA